MIKKFQVPLSFLILVAAIFWSFHGTTPSGHPGENVPENEFSVKRAFSHVEAIAQEPHYLGTRAHDEVRDYIAAELAEMGLSVEIQEGLSLNKYGTLAKPRNVLARIEGTGSGKALLLLSHYDSAVHSSYGASDAGSGVGTILEGVRAFLAAGKKPTNDIIIAFTDAEELGLNGADIFVNEHPWAKEVGLALNFESRGSGGESFMVLETNDGNSSLVEHFVQADPDYPVTNSLAYSVYKMLPNDTDLTVLREQANINGFNFAFIDDHFDYHTATDIPENLDKNTLAHQGSYLMPLLEYFSEIPLEDLGSGEDVIYFSVPIFDMVKYPFSWIFPMLILVIFLFIGLILYGMFLKRIWPREVLKGFLPLLISISVTGLLAFGLWEFCLFIYPEYQEMEHGFTYNGYYYISAVIFMALAICFYTYQRFQSGKNSPELFIAPLLLWIFLSFLAAVYLKGAAYFVIPVFFGLLQLWVMIRQNSPDLFLLSLLSLPTIFILMPFVGSFSVALGLKILFVTAILVVLLWTLLWPVMGYYKKNQTLGFLCFLVFIVLFTAAHFKSGFDQERPKPNSLVYLFDSNTQLAYWNTYDRMPDPWTEEYFDDAAQPKIIEADFSSKYNSGFHKSVKAPVIDVEEPVVFSERLGGDSLGQSSYRVEIVPQRPIDRIEIFTDEIFDFKEFTVNGLTARGLSDDEDPLHVFKKRWSRRLLTYYVRERDTLRLEFSVENGNPPDMIMYEASHDLLENDLLKVAPRGENMIPRPFVLNDAVVVKKRIEYSGDE